LPDSPLERWRPAHLTAPFRGGHKEPPLERWESVLGAEQSLGGRLARRAARVKTLEDRERRMARAQRSLLGRVLARLRPQGAIPPLGRNEIGRPRPGPLLDREIDAALGLLADVPFEELQERGWHVQPNSWVWPLNDLGFLRREPRLWARPQVPAGVRWQIDDQLDLVRRLHGYAEELADVPAGPGDRPDEFVWQNGSFGGMDAIAYYGLLRELAPRRVIEIGVGFSTLVLARAMRANGDGAEVTLIDPYPNMDRLRDMPQEWKLEHTMVQKVQLETFRTLEAGDVLFYDGSHCVETGGDVNWMLFKVLPALKPGVWIHFHDIFWPFDYPGDWILNEGLSWNEQYILQAFLMHNRAYRVRLANAMLSADPSRIYEELFPDQPFGCSVWIEKDPGWMKRLEEAGEAEGS
jgi:methyltransferase family protein